MRPFHIRRRLADANPNTFLPDVAATLNNLGTLYGNRHDVAAAQAAFDRPSRPRLAIQPTPSLPDLAGHQPGDSVPTA